MEVILVRHGQTEYNKKKVFHGWIDSELDETGIAQAENIAEALAGEKIDTIFTSPLKRAVDTAGAIASKAGIPVIHKVETLKEINFGLFEGHSYKDICEKYGQEAKKWEEESLTYCFPKGESIPMFYKRMGEFIDCLSGEDYQRVVLVTHEGCIKFILSYIITGSPDLFYRFKINTGSISRIHLDKGFSYILSINEIHTRID